MHLRYRAVPFVFKSCGLGSRHAFVNCSSTMVFEKKKKWNLQYCRGAYACIRILYVAGRLRGEKHGNFRVVGSSPLVGCPFVVYAHFIGSNCTIVVVFANRLVLTYRSRNCRRLIYSKLCRNAENVNSTELFKTRCRARPVQYCRKELF